MTRVVQWATGAVGASQLRAVIDDPHLELVGLFVYSPDKVGVDAGTLVDRAPTGVLATNDKSEIFGLDADVVLHAASKGFPVNTNTDDIVELLASGKSVITTTSYNHLPTFGQDAADRSRARVELRARASTPAESIRASCWSGSPRRSPGSANGSTASPCRSSSTAQASQNPRC
jgi:hypothetical protein